MPPSIIEVPRDIKSIQLEPITIALAGFTLSGKTAIAKELAARSNLYHVDADDFRVKIIRTQGGNPKERREYDKEKQIQRGAYKTMHAVAGKELAHGVPVVISASYSQPYYREGLASLGLAAPVKVFLLECPEDMVEERLRERQQQESASTVRDWDQYNFQKGKYQPIEGFPIVTIITNRPVRQIASEIILHVAGFRVPPTPRVPVLVPGLS